MARILSEQCEFVILDFDTEDEFEKAVIANSKKLFGEQSIYIDIKRKVGTTGSYHKGIPDAFLIDFFDIKNPQLYIVENELASHDIYSHITEQIGRFSVNAATNDGQIRDILLEAINKLPEIKKQLEELVAKTIFSNVTDLILNITSRKQIKIVIAINEITSDLNLSLKIFANQPDVVLLQRYQSGNKIIYYYEPMREEVEDLEYSQSSSSLSPDFDTVVCAALPDGFRSAYLENSAWWSIRMSQAAREKVKYLAIYEKNPIAHIEHYAEVTRIEPYKDEGKYILYLTNRKKLVKPIPLGKKIKGEAPQAPRYTTIDKLLSAKTIAELWK